MLRLLLAKATRSRRHAAAGILALGTLPCPTQAVQLTYEGTFEIESVPAGVDEIVPGDLFDVTFTFDDAVEDATPFTFAGSFPNATIAMTLSRHPSNMGTWDPDLATFTAFETPVTSNNGGLPGIPFDSFGLSGGGPGLPSVKDGAARFGELEMFFSTFDTSVLDDTGLGQTLREQFGGPFDPSLFPMQPVTLTFIEDTAIDVTASFIAISLPEPNASLLSLVAVATLAGLARSRRRLVPISSTPNATCPGRSARARPKKRS